MQKNECRASLCVAVKGFSGELNRNGSADCTDGLACPGVLGERLSDSAHTMLAEQRAVEPIECDQATSVAVR
jgi:hypothetical protein